MKRPLQIGRKGLITFWLGLSFALAAYYNACGQVSFDQSSTARLQSMQSTAQMVINNNDKFTRSELVSLTLDSAQSDEVYVSNDPSCASGGVWEPLNHTQNWTLLQRNTQAKVYAKFRNTREGLETSCIDDDIIHDNEVPLVVLNSPSAATNVATPIVTFVASDTLSGLDKMFCQWPGQAVSACNFSTSNGNLAEGRYLVKISASDLAGNVSMPVVHDLMVDRTPPVITILAGPSVLSSASAVNYVFDVNDALSGVKTIECSWENNTSYAACASPVAKNVTEGAHKFYIRALDNAGNSSEISHSFSIDMTAPSVRITSGPADFSNVAMAKFEFDGTDGVAPITVFQCRVDGLSYASCTSPKSYSGLTEGLHTFEVRGFDSANNPSAPAARSWYVDLTPPVITFIKTPPALSNMTAAEFKYTIADTGSGVTKAQCSLDNAAFADCAVDGKNLAGLAAGNHTFQVKGYDKAGNVGTSALIAFAIDLAAPTIQFTDTPGLISKLSLYTFKFTATDNQGVDRVECRLDAGNYLPCDSISTGKVAGLTDGNHQFSVLAYDGAGNVSLPAVYNWLVDLTPPVISYFQAPPAALIYGNPLSLGFTVNDSGSGVKSAVCTLDGSMVACQSGVLLSTPIAVGTHTFVVKAEDKAGNISSDSKSIAVSAPVMKSQNIDIKSNPNVDVLIVMDNSGSMSGEMANMAARMSTFIDQLAGLQWQLGIITTDVDNNNPLKDGRMVVLKDQPSTYILDYTMPLSKAKASFAATIQMSTNGSGREQGLKASIRAMDRSQDSAIAVNAPNVNLFRADSSLAVLVVSDSADTSGTRGESVIAKVKALWPNKAFAFHSIVVPESTFTNPAGGAIQSGDPCGRYRESAQLDGREYHRLSGLTGGIKGTVCSDDYGTQLKDMGKVTADLVKSVSLDCQPVDYNGDGKVDGADVKVTSASGQSLVDFTVMGNKLTFTNALPLGIAKFDYYCVQ